MQNPLARALATLSLGTLLFVSSSSAFGADTYANGQLSATAVTVGNITFSNLEVSIDGIISGPQGTSSLGKADSYDPMTNQLTVGAVMVGQNTYYNIVASVGQLVSVGSAAGADTYDGTFLTIASVLEDGAPNSNVVVTIETVLNVGGGMPLFAEDQYDSVSRELEIPAVTAGGKVYTNVLAVVGAFVSAGSGSVAPTITQLLPVSASAGSLAVPLTVNGNGFAESSIVQWNGNPLATTFISSTQLSALVPESDLEAPSNATITVTNAALGGPASNTQSFVVTAVPAAALTSLSPSFQSLGNPSFTLNVFGTGFTNESVVTWNGAGLATTFISPTQLSATVVSDDLDAVGSVQVSITDPASGGAAPTALTFSVTPPPTPTLTLLSPSSVEVGSAGFTLVVLGSNFGPTSVVQWNGNPVPTTLVSEKSLTVSIAAAQVSSPGSNTISVSNAGLASSTATLTVAAPSVDAVTYLMNPAHTGSVNFNAAHAPTLAWSIDVGGQPSYAIIADGAVFVTVVRPSSSVLLALDQVTGATKWGPIELPARSSATYDASTLYVLSSSPAGAAGVMQSIDATTGNLRWATPMPGGEGSSSPPTAANGLVFASGSSVGGNLYAFHEADGSVAWSQPVINGDVSSPAITADGVYVSYPCQTYDFLPALGSTNWHNSTNCDGGGGGTPVVANGVLYSPSNTMGAYAGTFFNSETGTALGSFSLDGPPALTTTGAYYVQDGTLRGMPLGSTTPSWSFAGDGGLTSPPIVINGYVIVASSSGNIYAVNSTTGHQAWSQNIGTTLAPFGAGLGVAALAAGDGLLVVPGSSTVTAYAVSDSP